MMKICFVIYLTNFHGNQVKNSQVVFDKMKTIKKRGRGEMNERFKIIRISTFPLLKFNEVFNYQFCIPLMAIHFGPHSSVPIRNKTAAA